MNRKELKQLRRSDLLEMMINLSKENEQLRMELDQMKSKLEEQTIAVENSGSIAEAALKLNGVFQAVQAACDQYSLNVQQRADEIIAQAQMQAKQILEEAEQKLSVREDK